MALTSRLTVGIVAEHTNALDLATPHVPLDMQTVIRLASGTAADQADKLWHDRRTLGASATEDLDLAGSLTDAFGVAFTLAKIKAILVKAAAANTNNVNIIRPAANGVPLFLAASDGVPVHPGGLLCWIAPGLAAVTVTAGTGDLLTFTNSGAGTSVTYDVVIIGASA